ncbi:hypothetical protein Bpfe_026324 [Biomphalaria pfeifferi]|uniref:Uncharacterized protein n=1 Tax=Biomphalaria pfeifferi TaxID=112525 RepID=A0AAD8B048_BIOPF|nr:hypothetical protein Bpfe_026324 [Biomphalaria pfeifferi]
MRDSARCPRFQSLHFRQSVKVKSRPGRKSFRRPPPFPSTPHGRVDSSNIGAHLDLQDCAGLRSDQHVRRHCVNFAAVPDSEKGAISTGGSSLSPSHPIPSPSLFTLFLYNSMRVSQQRLPVPRHGDKQVHPNCGNSGAILKIGLSSALIG